MTQSVEFWRSLLGTDHVITDPVILSLAETATFSTSQQIPAIVRPANLQQLIEVVHLANAWRIPIYPISSGKNWGYGSRVPVETGCTLVDLSRMNQITHFDETLGLVTVQPGVTQRQLWDFLQEKKSGFWMDATGSSPDCSLIGNAVERGFGHTPYGDHFANVCGLEVVLPTGDVIRTGFSGLPNARAGGVYRWGAGPSLDGLFSQSNFGIVTGMTIWLMPAPEYFEAYFFQSNREEGLADMVDGLRPLRMNGTLKSAIHIGNDYKVLAGISQFPWNEQAPLSRATMQRLGAQLKFSRWSGSGALYGTKAQVREGKRLVKAALAGRVDKLQFLNDRTLAFASKFTRPYKWITGVDLSRTLELLAPVYGLLKGIPTQQTLGSAYWRKRIPTPPDPDPDRDRCGSLWIAPVAPMLGSDARAMVEITERILLDFGFEPQISITLLTERSISCVISISFDREIPGQDDQAIQCFRELRANLEKTGYYSYRLGILAMPLPGSSSYADLLRSLKATLDPNNVLSPGRYVPNDVDPRD